MGKIIKIFKNTDDLSQFFGKILSAQIQDIPDGKYFSIALSGGSTPKAVFHYLALNFRKKINWDKLLIFWSDERCVASDDQESNFKMTKDSLLDQLPVPAKNIFRIMGENDPSAEATRYAEAVRQFVPDYYDIPRFDLMMLGLGEDGHTASIFPGNLHFFNSEKLFDLAIHPLTKQKRITATGTLINNSKTVVFLVIGEAKSELVSLVLENKPGSENLPASLVQPVNGELFWLLDEKAAGKLTSNYQQ